MNSELFSLAGRTWNQENSTTGDDQSRPEVDSWMHDYANVLCINSWQVHDSYCFLISISFLHKGPTLPFFQDESIFFSFLSCNHYTWFCKVVLKYIFAFTLMKNL